MGYRAFQAAGGSSASAIGVVPAGVVDGDAEFAFILATASSTTITTAPTGWALVRELSPSGFKAWLYERTGGRQSGDSNNPTWVLSGSTGWTCDIWVGPGIRNAENGAVNTGANALAVAVTPSVADATIITWRGADTGTGGEGRTWTVTGTPTPVGLTERTDSNDSTAYRVVADDVLAGGSGVSTSRTCTITGAATPLAGFAIALAPPVTVVTGSVAAPLGGLTVSASAAVTSPLGAVAAPLGGLAVTASAVRRTPGSVAAPLGGLAAAATAVRRTAGSVVAPLGGLALAAAASFTSYLGASGRALNPVVWRVDRTTLGIVGPPLLHWEQLDLSPIANTPGSCQLSYPAGAPGFAQVYDQVQASPQRDQEIEVWLGGSAATRTRWLLQQKAGDDLRPGDLWKFDGVGLEQLLAEVLVGPQATETKELLFSGVTYGTILITALQQAQARDGVLVGITWDFTTTLDSNGDPWEETLADLAFAPDDTLLAVAQIGPTEVVGEFAIGPDRVLYAWNYGARGTDRTTGATPLRLQAGANLSEASRRESSRVGEAATATLAKGAEGQYQWATDATAQAQRGRRVEVAVDAGQVATAGGVAAAAEGRLFGLVGGAKERTHGVVFGRGLPLPGLDYDVADRGLSIVGGTASPERIVQWTLQLQREGRARGTVRTSTLIEHELDRLARQLDRVRRGATVVGTSTASPEVDDGKAPAQVLGLAASSSAYRDADGATQAVVLAAWSAVTTNADATAADDIVGYRPAFRYTGGAPLPSGWQPVAQVAGNAVDFDGLVAGQPIEVRVQAVDKFGNLGAVSASYALTTGADATPPPVLPAPVGSAYIGLTKWDWNGRGAAGEAMPPDFLEAELHLSTSSGFTPDRPLLSDGKTLDTAASTTYRDRLTGAGELPVDPGGAYGITWYAKWVAVDRSRNASAASAQGSATRVTANDGDIGAVSIGKLTAGIMSALMTISGIIRTATSGSRVELDVNGLRCYLGTALVFDFSIPSALLTITGKLIAGAGVGSGATVVIDPTIAAMDLHPDATAAKFRKRAFVTDLPGGGTGQAYIRQMVTAAGAVTGATLVEWTTGVFHGFRVAGVIRGGRLSLGAPTSTDGARLIYADTTTGVNAEVVVGRDGGITLNPSSGEEVRSIGPFGTQASGFSFRAQNGQIEGYRMAAISGVLRFVENASNQALSDGAGGFKSFVIPHPVDEQRWLVHVCTEGPSAGVEYHGIADVVDHAAIVELPPYFEQLVRAEGRHVQVSVLVGDEPDDVPPTSPGEPLLGPGVDLPGALEPGEPGLPALPEWADLPRVAASVPRNGRFRITSSAATGQVAWRVFAVRADVPELDVEPLRGDVEVRGDGPYRYLVR